MARHSSAKAPRPVAIRVETPITLAPTGVVTSGPAAATSPTNSRPGVKGMGGFIG